MKKIILFGCGANSKLAYDKLSKKYNYNTEIFNQKKTKVYNFDMNQGSDSS